MQRRPFTIRRLFLMVSLCAVALGCLMQFGTTPYRLVFMGGIVGAGTAFGAAAGVAFDRTAVTAALGALAGMAFFLFAIMN